MEKDLNFLLSNCIKYALEKHKDQTDYSNIPYVVHLISVMNGVNSEEEKIVAILHDILEDTSVTSEQLINDLGFTIQQLDIVNAIIAITHIENEPNSDYIDRVKANKLATKVKIADLKHNMDLTRMKDLDEELVTRLNKKHVAAYRRLVG